MTTVCGITLNEAFYNNAVQTCTLDAAGQIQDFRQISRHMPETTEKWGTVQVITPCNANTASHSEGRPPIYHIERW